MTPAPNATRATGELLPCPFCGSEAREGAFYDGDDWLVECRECGAKQWGTDRGDEAIAAWNRRAPLPPAVVDAGTLAAIDGFVDTVIDGVFDSYLDAYDVQEWAVDRGIIARVECGGMDGDCEICAESDTDYHYVRVLYARDALATAVQPAWAVPSRVEVSMAITEFGLACARAQKLYDDDGGDHLPLIGAARARLDALIYGDAPADASENGGAAILAAAALTPADDAGAGGA